MGKGRQFKTGKKKGFRSVPLAQQLSDEKSLKVHNREKKRKRPNDDDDEFVSNATSKKIFKQARKQRAEELESEESRAKKPRMGEASDDEDPDDYVDDEEPEEDCNDLTAATDMDAEVEFAKFAQCGNLRKLVNSRRAELIAQCPGAPEQELPKSVEEIYRKVGQVMSQWRGTKVPKGFSSIVKLGNCWEYVLDLTNPEKWTAASIYAATVRFTSNLNSKDSPRFVERYLLPRVRDDIKSFSRLNPHLFKAIKQTLFKDAAFFVGFLFPLVTAGDCTLREATIVSAVMKKVSINAKAAGAAVIHLARELPWNGASLLFLTTLIGKKYSFGPQVIEAVADFFISFKDLQMKTTVIWHQALLTFAQVHKLDITSEQREKLLELIAVHRHKEISEEIRRELCFNEEETEEEAAQIQQNDVEMN